MTQARELAKKLRNLSPEAQIVMRAQVTTSLQQLHDSPLQDADKRLFGALSRIPMNIHEPLSLQDDEELGAVLSVIATRTAETLDDPKAHLIKSEEGLSISDIAEEIGLVVAHDFLQRYD